LIRIDLKIQVEKQKPLAKFATGPKPSYPIRALALKPSCSYRAAASKSSCP